MVNKISTYMKSIVKEWEICMSKLVDQIMPTYELREVYLHVRKKKAGEMPSICVCV